MTDGVLQFALTSVPGLTTVGGGRKVLTQLLPVGIMVAEISNMSHVVLSGHLNKFIYMYDKPFFQFVYRTALSLVSLVNT